MRTKKALFNFVGLLASEGVIFLTGLILPRLILVAYGSAINGLLSSIRQLLNYLQQLQMGLTGAATVALYKPLAERDDAKVSQIVSATRQFFAQIGALFLLGSTLLSFFYPFLIDRGNLPWQYVSVLVFLLALPGAVGFFFVSSHRILLVADQRSYITSLVSAFTGLLSLLITAVIVSSRCDVAWIPIVSGISVVIQALLLSHIVKKNYSKRFQFNVPYEKGVISQRWDVFIFELSVLIQINSPVIIVTFFIGLIEVSIYIIYDMVFHSMQSLVRMLSRSLGPSFGEVIALGSIETLRQAYSEYEYIIYILTFWFYTCAGLLLMPFIKLYTKGIFDADYIRPIVGMLFLMIGVNRQLHVPAATIVAGAGKYREIRGNNIIVATISVIGGCVGCYTFGLEGVLVGLLIASACKTVYLLIFSYRHILQLSPWRSIDRIVRNFVLSGVAWLILVTLFHVSPISPMKWVVCAMGVTVWVGTIIIGGNVILDRSTTSALLNRFIRIYGFRRKVQPPNKDLHLRS